jgi:hypothetical protein
MLQNDIGAKRGTKPSKVQFKKKQQSEVNFQKTWSLTKVV